MEVETLLRQNSQLLKDYEELDKEQRAINEKMKEKESQIIINRQKVEELKSGAAKEKMLWLRAKQGEF